MLMVITGLIVLVLWLLSPGGGSPGRTINDVAVPAVDVPLGQLGAKYTIRDQLDNSLIPSVSATTQAAIDAQLKKVKPTTSSNKNSAIVDQLEQ